MYRYILLVPVVCLLCVPPLLSQVNYDSVEPATRVIFLNDVRVMNSPSDTSSFYDIVIREGVIAEIGDSITAPPEAKTMAVDSMYVYPSFIDVLSHTAIEKPERRRSSRSEEGERPRPVNPALMARDKFKKDDKSVGSLRKAGFAISHAVPAEGMLAGQGHLLLLDSDPSILEEGVSQFMQFSGQRGSYPGTIIGVMAHWRDLYRSAGYYQRHRELYESAPRGKKRPEVNRDLEALIPVLENKQKVYTPTDNIKEVFRALELQKELGYKLVLADVKKVAPAIEKIRNQDAELALSLDLPEKMEDDEKKRKGDDKKTDDSKEENTEVPDPELEALKMRKKEAIREYESQAAELEKAGVRFGFSMLNSKPSDVKGNINRMIAAGLSETAAMEALTMNGAMILGIENMAGSVEKGKWANLFITDAPWLRDEATIVWVALEGVFEEMPKKKKRGKSGDSDFLNSILGQWSFSIEIPEDSRQGTISIESNKGEPEIVVVESSQPENSYNAFDIVIEASRLIFKIMVSEEDVTFPVTLSLDFEGDTFSGNVVAEGREAMPVEGERIDSPE